MMEHKKEYSIDILGKSYHIYVLQRIFEHSNAPKLVTVCYIDNYFAREITRLCIQTIQRFTDTPFELWVVDNNSPREYVDWLCLQQGINIILNRTIPSASPPRLFERLGLIKRNTRDQMSEGSFANAVGLELAARIIDPASQYLFVMHNDVLVCKSGWLEFLKSKFSDNVRGAAVSHDPIRMNAMHVSGILFDFTLFKPLNMNFLPNLPEHDVGDLVTIRLREAGYQYYLCKNTFNNPETIELISPDNPLRNLYSDRVFDDEGNVIYLHLGRGTPKSVGTYHKAGKTSPEQWIQYAETYLLR